MHYRNNRPAKEGDAVLGESYKGSGLIITGVIHSLQPGSDSCNCQVTKIIPGGTSNACVSIGDLYHAEDAWAALQEKQPPEKSS